MTEQNLDMLSINTIKLLSVDSVEKAKSGHPGAPMGAAPMAYVLWKDFLKHLSIAALLFAFANGSRKVDGGD